jgi:hypothetical protein
MIEPKAIFGGRASFIIDPGGQRARLAEGGVTAKACTGGEGA